MREELKRTLIDQATAGARRLLEEDNPEKAREDPEDLIDDLEAAKDAVRDAARMAGLHIRPRPVVEFPDPRSVATAACQAMAVRAAEMMGIPWETGMAALSPTQMMEAAPELAGMISENTWLGRYDESVLARRAVAELEDITAAIAAESIRHLQEANPARERALVRAALAEIAGEEAADERMRAEFGEGWEEAE